MSDEPIDPKREAEIAYSLAWQHMLPLLSGMRAADRIKMLGAFRDTVVAEVREQMRHAHQMRKRKMI